MKLSSIAGTQGIGFAQETFVGKASEDIAKGDLVQCLLTALEPDDDISISIASVFTHGIYGIALEAITNGKRGLCCLSGKVEAKAGATEATLGKQLMGEAGGGLVQLTGNDVACVGLAVDAGTDGSLHTVIFDGFQLDNHGTT